MKSSFLPILNYHMVPVAVFVALATLFLWDVLFLNYSLGAFDIILSQANWKGEFWFGGIHQPILSDSPTAHYPQREFDWGHVRQLNNADFNAYMFTGMPWSSQGVGGFITSIPQLFLDVKNAIDWSTWIRLICAGFFMYLLVLELGLDRTSGVFAGILWTYSLHQLVWLEFPQHLATQLWIPLVFLLNIRIFQRGFQAPSVAALLIVNVLFFTSGYMQIVLYTYVSIGLFNTVYVLIHLDRTGIVGTLRLWTGIHGVYVAAVALCAVGLYSEAQYISEGLRGAQDWRGRVEIPDLGLGSLKDLIASFFPRFDEVTQVLTPDYYGGIWSGRYDFGRGNIVENGRYFGFLGLLFAIAALLATRHREHGRIVIVFAVVMGLVFSMLYRNEFTISGLRLIPFADKGSYSRFITLLTFMGCVLAGIGLYYVRTTGPKWIVASLAIIGAYVLAAWFRMEDFAIEKLWYPAVIAAVLAVVIVCRGLPRLKWQWIGIVVVLISVIDLFAAGYAFNTRMENDRLFPRNNSIRFLLNDPEPYRVAVISERPLYHPNILSYYDIPVVEGYLTVLPVDYAEYIKNLFPKAHVTRNGILFILEPSIEALRLMNVKYILSDENLAEKYDGLEHVIDSNNHFIFRIKRHLPRIFCASDIFFVNKERKQLERYRDLLSEFDEPLVLTGKEDNKQYSGDCRIDDLRVLTHGLTAEIEVNEERYLAVPYAFNRHWSATIDGRPAELVKANGYHMAVRVPAGNSALEIVYENRLNQLSALILILASVGVLLLAWRLGRETGLVRPVLVAAALVIILKSSLSLPFVRNFDIPEREPLAEKLQVERQGERRTDRTLHSVRVLNDRPLELPLHIESQGLTRVSLLAGTFHQRVLAQDITVELLSRDEVLVTKQVEGQTIANNNWFSIEFPPVREDAELYVRISTEEPDESKSFILWLDETGKLCVLSYYQFEA